MGCRSGGRPGPGYIDELTPEEIAGENYFQLIDEEGKLITITGHRLAAGDRYLAADNRLYEVKAVEQYTARARFKEEIELISRKHRGCCFHYSVQGNRPSRKCAIYIPIRPNAMCPVTAWTVSTGMVDPCRGRAFRDALTAKGIGCYIPITCTFPMTGGLPPLPGYSQPSFA